MEHVTEDNSHPTAVRKNVVGPAQASEGCTSSRAPGGARPTTNFSSRLLPPQVSLPFPLDSWIIATEFSLHVDDDVTLAALCLSAAIAIQTTFSDTVLQEDDVCLPILLRQLGVQEPALRLAGNGEDIRLANLISFVCVCLTAKLEHGALPTDKPASGTIYSLRTLNQFGRRF